MPVVTPGLIVLVSAIIQHANAGRTEFAQALLPFAQLLFNGI